MLFNAHDPVRILMDHARKCKQGEQTVATIGLLYVLLIGHEF